MKCTVARLGLAPLLEASEPVALAAGARPSRASDAVRLLTYNCWARVGHTATPPHRHAATPPQPAGGLEGGCEQAASETQARVVGCLAGYGKVDDKIWGSDGLGDQRT